MAGPILTSNPWVFYTAGQGEGKGTAWLLRNTFTAAVSDIVTMTAHGLITGDGPVQLTNSGGALPAGLAVGTDYWIIKIDADTFYLAASQSDAKAGTQVDITGTGTGTHSLRMLPLHNHKIYVKTIIVEAAGAGGTFEVKDSNGGKSLTGSLTIAANAHERFEIFSFVKGVYMEAIADGQVLVYHGRP
jgi:hypothetical protein